MRRKITNDTWEQIKTAYAAGVNFREIARNMGISAGTIHKQGQTRTLDATVSVREGSGETRGFAFCRETSMMGR